MQPSSTRPSKTSLGIGSAFAPLILIYFLHSLCCNLPPPDNRCVQSRAKSCTECIRVAKECSFCTEESFEEPRCDLRENLLRYGCREASIVYTRGEMRT